MYRCIDDIKYAYIMLIGSHYLNQDSINLQYILHITLLMNINYNYYLNSYKHYLIHSKRIMSMKKKLAKGYY